MQYLEHHVKEHVQTLLPREFPCQIGRREVKQVCSCLRADGVNQHLLPHTPGPSQHQRLDKRGLLVDCLGAYSEGRGVPGLYPASSTSKQVLVCRQALQAACALAVPVADLVAGHTAL